MERIEQDGHKLLRLYWSIVASERQGLRIIREASERPIACLESRV